ncbi:hypothetical protein ACSAZK_13940 [Methanosarcina sp. Mfa9]|uniref:hypothetical protein n=1 Tax=Methanosarcina sp. Mfa9 TaxID=3439063 RepID=UPI003F86909F
MKLINYNKYLIIVLLAILNLIIRYPSIPHEMGNDSFSIHILANSITEFGSALWWLNALSIFGMYPYSYASASPFVLSGISQTANFEVEFSIRVFGAILGFFSIFSAYLLAEEIWNNNIFKSLVAFVFSLSPGVLVFTTWDASARGLFIVYLPLFLYLLLKTRTQSIRYIILTVILFILLMATHHLYYLTIPAISSYIICVILNKLNQRFGFRTSNDFFDIMLIVGLPISLFFPFISGFLVETTKYNELYMMAINNTRYTGILLFYSFIGLIYLLFKRNKFFEDYFLLIFMLFFAPLLYIQTYAHYFIIIFSCIFIGLAITNIVISDHKKRNYALSILIISLLVSVGFSGLYQHWRTNLADKQNNEWYMDESAYAGSVWIKENIDKNQRLVGNDNIMSKRMFAISEVPIFLEDVDISMLIYGFADINNTPIHKNSFMSLAFYKDNPYVIQQGFTQVGWHRNMLQDLSIDSPRGKGIVEYFNLSYVIENTQIQKNCLITSLYNNNNNYYDNGKIRLWWIG